MIFRGKFYFDALGFDLNESITCTFAEYKERLKLTDNRVAGFKKFQHHITSA